MKKLLLLFVVFAFLFSGCLTPTKTEYCCNMAEAQKGQCEVTFELNGKTTITKYPDSDCDIAKGKCNVTRDVKDSNGNVVDSETLAIPICTEKIPVPCINSSCTAMVCGPINYVPNPFKDQKSAEELYGDAKDTITTSKPVGAFAALSNDATKLYQGTCKFLPVDNFFKYVFENTEGSYINTFRFGTGQIAKQYERSWPYLPVTDYYCGLNGKGTVDRYMNYLVDQSYFDSYLKAYHSNKPANIKQFIEPDACLKSTSSSKINLHSTTYGGYYGEYLTNEEEVEKTVIAGEEELTYLAPIHTEIDSEFYSKALRFIYDQDIQVIGKAPFECESSTDCMSGTCGFGTYSRGVCLKKDGKYADCLCGDAKFDDSTSIMAFVMNCESKTPPAFAFGNSVTLNRQTIEEAASTQINLLATYSIWDPDFGTFYLPKKGEIVLREFKEEELEAIEGMDIFTYDKSAKKIIGYATTDLFKDTAFAKECGLSSGTDYVTYTGFTGSGSIPGGGAWVSGNWEHPVNYTLIFGIGKCVAGEILNTAPQVKKFGWCEPCTLSTMAKASLTTTNGKAVENEVNYFKGKTIEYLQRDVLPVVTFVQGFWDEIDNGATVETLAKDEDIQIGAFLDNNGPYIVVIDDIGAGANLPPASQTKKRSEYIRKVCNRCITAFGISERHLDIADTSESWNSQFTKNMLASRVLFGATEPLSPNFKGCYDEFGNILKTSNPIHCDKDMLSSIDILLFDFYPNDMTQGNSELCTKDETQYSAVLGNMTELGYKLLQEFHKPSMVYNYGIKADSCWTNSNPNSISGFMNYLVENQHLLTKSGIIGMFYSDYYDAFSKTALIDVEVSPEGNYLYDTKGDKFCSVQKSINILGGKKPIYSYFKRYETETVNCVEKTEVQKLKETAGIITGSPLLCANNVKCKLPVLSQGKTEDDYMCPLSTIASPCKKCSESTATIRCTYTYSDGSTKQIDKFVSSLVYLDQDILSSLPKDLVCCVEDSSDPGNLYTYIKTGADSNYHSPVIFSSNGNADEDCGVYPKTQETNSCGAASSQLKNYKVDCEKV